jgi:hypothetical protein
MHTRPVWSDCSLHAYIVAFATLKVKRNFLKSDNFFPIIKNMEIKGLTIREMAEKLELPYKTVEKRLKRAGIEPITTGTIYPASALETIRDVRMGRPVKKPEAPDKEKKGK